MQVSSWLRRTLLAAPLWLMLKVTDGFLLQDTPVSYVMEPFESIHDEWFLEEVGPYNYTISNTSSLFGDGALEVKYISDSTNDSASFGWILSERAHNCFGATELSIWYKAELGEEELADESSPVRLTVSLLDDSFCMNSPAFNDPILPKHLFCGIFADEVTVFDQNVTGTTLDFQELKFDLSSFAIDLTRLRGWKIEIQGMSVGDNVLFDQLACHGDGALLGAAFHTDRSLEESVAEGSWMESYYNSYQAENYTVPVLKDGTLSIKYLVEQVETWGGFNDYAHLAPGAAYYNFSQATNLVIDYDVTEVASIPGRAIFRLLLQDNSHCTEDCDSDYHSHSRWYSFNSILDDAGPGTVAIPLVGSTESSTPFWSTGWSGISGDPEMSVDEIKGFTLELVLDSELELGEVVTGAVAFRNMAVAYSSDTADTEVSYVMEPFESIPWKRVTLGDATSFNATTSAGGNAWTGNHSLELRFDVQNTTTRSSVSSIIRGRAHNCYSADYFSFWYKSVEPGARIRIILFDDTDCIADEAREQCDQEEELKPHAIFEDELSGDGEWREIKSADFDGINLARIRGWRVDILGGAGTVFLDQLACVGGGSMLSSAFHVDPSQTLEDAISDRTWIRTFYNSEISANKSITSLQDGILAVDYTVQQVESWGGYIDFAHLAPGDAYYNLSQATDLILNYHVNEANSIPGRAIFRFVLQDNSDCTFECDTNYHSHERWYSFHSILDETGAGEVVLPLVGSTEPDTPLWLTGWSGVLGNEELNLEEIKGFTIEIVLDSVLALGSIVTGSVEFFDFSAIISEEAEETITEEQCIVQEDMHIFLDFPGLKRIEFLSAQCCEVCADDPECNYAMIGGRDCYLASYIDPNYVGLLNNEILQFERTTLWMDDASKRGDFCERCVCRPDENLIDCKGEDLAIVPKTFQEDWNPRILDLRDNPRLSILGSGSLTAIAENLEEIRLPANMKNIATQSLLDLPRLSTVHLEGDEVVDHQLGNAIASLADFFDDVCCGIGSVIELDGNGASENSLSFCHLRVHVPGIDSVYEPFIHYVDATAIQALSASSSFMSEAAESAEKCAEYCTINDECAFFGYDARRPNSEHTCHLYADTGSGPHRVCCSRDHFADDLGTIPGWISGRPPLTRHELDGARVNFSTDGLLANSKNGFQTSYEVSLGSTPLRGAVWVDIDLITESTGLDVTIEPSRLVLYNHKQIGTVTVTLHDVTSDSPSATLILKNQLESCDEAFTVTGDSDDNLVYVVVEVPDPDDKVRLGVAIGFPLVVLFVVIVGVFLFYENKRKENDGVWKVRKEDLEFADPPEIVGRGTFGLVLLAEYRGTQVAVKRVLPPRDKSKSSSRSNNTGMNSSLNGSSSKVGSDSGSHNVGTASGSNHPGTASGSNNPGLLSGSHRVNPGLESGSYPAVTSGSNVGPPFPGSKPERRRYNSTNAAGFSSPSHWKASGIISNVFSLGKLSRNGKTSVATWKKLKQEFIEEMRYMAKLRHPCVTTVMGAVIGNNDDPMLVMEYMEHGSLYDILHNETMPIDGELLLPILRDIAQGMRFLHSATPQVLHGDLKAANILVDSKFRAKVADFGLSQKKNLGGTGTPFWMAPELLRRESANTAATDVYSFGIVLYEVYSRKDPYDGEDPLEVLRLVADKEFSKRPPVPETCPAQVHSLMTDCIVDDPGKRPTFEEVDTRLKRVNAAMIETNELQKKSAAISLFDIFPRHIAEALRDGKTVEAEHRDVATIFFSDIVGFTSISAELPPRKVASLLDRLYTKFDALSQKHDVFKVETIGDAYMAVTNLVKKQPDDHCKRIAEFAMDAVAAANGTYVDLDAHDKGYVNIRVGFHSGSIVADVVGTRNPRYCLFGDAVNTASRMESTSKANRIHCSNKSASLLMEQCPEIALKSRGLIPVKGKGDMNTYWVNYFGPPVRRRGSPKSQGMQTVRECENSGELLVEAPVSKKNIKKPVVDSERTAETAPESVMDSDESALDLEAQLGQLEQAPECAPNTGAPLGEDKSILSAEDRITLASS